MNPRLRELAEQAHRMEGRARRREAYIRLGIALAASVWTLVLLEVWTLLVV